MKRKPVVECAILANFDEIMIRATHAGVNQQNYTERQFIERVRGRTRLLSTD